MIRLLVAATFLTLAIVFTPTGARAQADYKRYYDEDNLPKVQGDLPRGPLRHRPPDL